MCDPAPLEGENGAEYRLLKGSEVRLLTVALGAWDDQISCKIHYVPLDERPEYVALSYAWGDASDQVDILLDGRPHRVTRGLFTALRRFRQQCVQGRTYDGFTFAASANETTYLWADALCINQADECEKEREIPRMRQVYTLCSRVCAWLGENDDLPDDDAESKAVLEEVERWLENGSFSANLSREEHLTLEERLSLRQELKDHFGPRLETCLDLWQKLGRRAWFKRIWVIQEAALPTAEPILMAGKYLFGFDRFTRPWMVFLDVLATRLSWFDVIGSHFFLHQALYRTRVHVQISPIQTEGEFEDQRTRFGRMFTQAVVRRGVSGFIATMPHDLLYSMIGLCGGGELLPPELAPNYHKTFPSVCEDYARCIIKATGSLAILGRTFNRLRMDYEEAVAEKVPSWVPDFRALQMPVSVEGDMEASYVTFMGLNERFLKIRGVEVGKITKMCLSLQHSEDTEEFIFSEQLRRHRQFLEDVARERNISPEDAVTNWLQSRLLSVGETLWGTLPTLEDLQAIYDHYLQQDGDDHHDSRAGSLRDSYMAKRFVELSWGDFPMRAPMRSCLLVQGGMDAEVGTMHYDEFKEGDRIVALSGCSSPFIVTPVLTDEGPGYVLRFQCTLYDGASQVKYTADDFSLEEGRCEEFMIV